MSNLLSLSFWFNARPEPFGPFGQKVMLIIAAALFVIGILCLFRFFIKSLAKHNSILRKIGTLLITNAFVVCYFWFLDNQIVPVLRARAWYGIWAIVDILWIIAMIRSYRKKIKWHESQARNAELDRYIP